MRLAAIPGNRPGNFTGQMGMQGVSVTPWRLPGRATSAPYPLFDDLGLFPTSIMPLREFCDWVWRVRLWSATITVNDTQWNAIASDAIPLGREQNLLAYTGQTITLDERDGMSGSVAILGSHQCHGDYFGAGRHGFRPLVKLQIFSNDEEGTIRLGSQRNAIGNSSVVGRLAINSPGPTGTSVAVVIQSGTTPDVDFSGSIQAAEWFEYRDARGQNPVYRSGDGAELRNPFASPVDWQNLSEPLPRIGTFDDVRFVSGVGLTAEYAGYPQ